MSRLNSSQSNAVGQHHHLSGQVFDSETGEPISTAGPSADTTLLVHGTGAPAVGQNQVYNVNMRVSASSGTFRLSVAGNETANIPYNTTLGELIIAVEAVVGAGNCIMNVDNAGSLDDAAPDDSLYIEFAGDLAATPVLVTVANDSTDNGNVSADEETAGHPTIPTESAPAGIVYVDDNTSKFYINLGTLEAPQWQWEDALADAAYTSAGTRATESEFTAHTGDADPHHDAILSQIAGGIGDHNSRTTNVHGILDTSTLAQYFDGSTAPTSGYTALPGQIYHRNNAGVGELWVKVGPGNTDWQKVTTS